ncbi:hypothetical protein U1Q18_043230 [Sarracenia purpurea var. burkii]
MASAMRSSVRPLGPSAITTTTTLTLDHFLLFPSSTQEQQQQQQPSKALTLRLNRRTKKVTWKEGTIDNEFLQKKSSKKCCIFHKEKPFDEDDSDTDAENQSNGNDRPNKVHHRHPDDVCCLIGRMELVDFTSVSGRWDAFLYYGQPMFWELSVDLGISCMHSERSQALQSSPFAINWGHVPCF